MSDGSKIEWTEATWNPLAGCSLVSPGCLNCYAMRMAARLAATATPSPNDYIELLAYSAFLGIMDVSQAKTRFFKRDSTKADELTLHPQHEMAMPALFDVSA